MGARSILVAVMAITLLSACVPDGSELPAPTPETPPATSETTVAPPTTATASATPTPSPSTTVIQSFPPPPADETAEEAAIREGWMNYWKVFDMFLKDASLGDFTEARLVTVTGSQESLQILDIISAYRNRGVVAVGDRQFRDILIGPATDVDGELSAIVSYCHDSSSLALVDAKSGAPSDILPILTMREEVMLERGIDGVWRVASVKNQDDKC